MLGFNVAGGLRSFLPGPNRVVSGRTFAIALFLPILFYSNAIQSILLSEGINKCEYWYCNLELNRENAGWLLVAPGMPALVAISNDLRLQSERQGVAATRFTWQRSYFRHETEKWKPYEKTERGIIPDDALTIGYGLGRFYFMPDLKVLDYYGLTDATVARTPSTRANRERAMARPQTDTRIPKAAGR